MKKKTLLQRQLDNSIGRDSKSTLCALWILGAEKGTRLPKIILEKRQAHREQTEQE